jgi:hypothetical protein
METTYFAVSLPVFTRVRSSDFFDPSKTTLRGIIRRFPCAITSLEVRMDNRINPERKRK